MKRVYLLVEGQTEETFVRYLLAPHFADRKLFITSIIVKTSPGYKGGITSYVKVKPQIERLCKQDPNAIISTLFDLYALPADFPGKNMPGYSQQCRGEDKAKFIECEMKLDIPQSNFIPYLQTHEFEALLFTDLTKFDIWIDDKKGMPQLYAAREEAEPEDINGGKTTAPSKRILSALPEYRKTTHGPLIASDIGIDKIRLACPHFNEWLIKLEGLV